MANSDLRRNAFHKVETEGLESNFIRFAQGLFSVYRKNSFPTCVKGLNRKRFKNNISENNAYIRFVYDAYKKKICAIIEYAKYYIYRALTVYLGIISRRINISLLN